MSRYEHPRNVYRTAWGTWFCQLRWHGEKIYIGSFETMDEAVEARDAFMVGVEGVEPPSAGC
jgi:hypothetical protein